MVPNPSQVEKIVEIVTREVLIALAEQEQLSATGEHEKCTQECVGNLCVRT
jgi:hypothetical protein